MSTATNKTVIRTDLGKYLNTKVVVKFVGGRNVTGILKGLDDIVNLVLDECTEYLRDVKGEITQRERFLGLVVARGTAITSIHPVNGFEEIPNPFVNTDE